LSPGPRYSLRAASDAYLIQNVTFSVSSDVLAGGTFTLSNAVNLSCENISRVGADYIVLGYEKVEYPGVPPQQITSVAITFVVPLARITTAGISSTGVSLLRYDGAAWRRLPTTLLGSSGGSATYAASSSGLSVFAVVVPVPIVIQTPSRSNGSSSTQVNGSGVPSGTGGVGVNQSGGLPPETQAAGSLVSKVSFWLVILLVLLLGGGLVDYFYYRRRRHEAHAAVTEAYSQAAVGQPATITDPAEVALEKLRGFIGRELARGHTKEQIRAVLLKAGWQVKVIDEELGRQ
jgi:hypothetical protein